MTESDISGEVRRIIAELRPGLSVDLLLSHTGLSALGYTRAERAELHSALEVFFEGHLDRDALDREDVVVADIERLVLHSLAMKGTPVRAHKAATDRPKGPDLRAHMRAEDLHIPRGPS